MDRLTGNYVGYEAVPSNSLASGLFTLSRVAQAVKSSLWPQAVDEDPYWADTILMLTFDDYYGITTVEDHSKANNAITVVGGAVGRVVGKNSGGCFSFDGSGDYLTIPTSTNFDLGSGDFTVEMWVKTSQTANYATLLNREWGGSPYTGAWSLMLNGATNVITLYCVDYSSGSPLITCSAGANDGGWHHIAWVRNGDVHTIYKDGVSIGSATNSFSFTSTSKNITIGNDLTFGSGARAYNGQLDDLRITKGVARYTTGFTPPTKPIRYPVQGNVVLCIPFNHVIEDISPREIALTSFGNVAISATQSKFNGNSGVFDGSGDYLTFANATWNDLSSKPFTVEMYVRFTALAAAQVLMYKGWYGSDEGFSFFVSPTNMSFSTNNANTIINKSYTFTTDTWYHLAWVHDGTNLTFYVDGNSIGSSAATVTNVSRVGTIGTSASNNPGNYFNGYMQDLVVTTGYAKYTANFVPPVSVLQPASDPYANKTVLQLRYQGANDSTTFTDDKGKTVTPSGNAKITTTGPRYGSSCGTFDGTDDYLTVATSADFDLGSGDFTIETWFYPTAEARYAVFAYTADFSLAMDYHYNGTRNVNLWASSNGSSWNMIHSDGGGAGIGTISLILNEWNHIAVTRRGNVFRSFVNGVKDREITVSGSIYTTGRDFRIGTWGNGSYDLNGKLADTRVTKGVARYIDNFPPPAPLI